jgi:hypothetical protein
MSFRQFARDVWQSKGIEGKVLMHVLVSVITSFVVLGVLYFFRLRDIPTFNETYRFFLFFAVITYALLAGVLVQVRAFGQFPCMSGMMIGMTTGMIAGFLPGFFIAATNGMFVGSMVGMGLGITIGIIAGGRACGVMGFMEGIMAGFMGGLMGAMTSFMLFNDHLRATTTVISFICSLILISLNYLLYVESKQLEQRRTPEYLSTTVFTFIAIVLTTWFMVYGPKSGVFG